MSDTELTILRQMFDEQAKAFDEYMAAFQRLSGPERAIESHVWFRKEIAKEIAKAVAPLAERLAQIETKPAPRPALQPSRQYEENLVRSIGQHIKEEIRKRDQRIEALESKMANWKYCGVWSAGKYLEGNFVTHQGSLFSCLWPTEAEPGTDSSWQLCCKRGKDATADNVRRLASASRG